MINATTGRSEALVKSEGGASLPPHAVELTEPWRAELSLGFVQRRGGTCLATTMHRGPLRVQRPFYPEGPDGTCHVYVLHPPGGVVGGDQLSLEVDLDEGTRALLTAPGASKLYRARAALEAAQRGATVTQHFRVANGATLEWLPHETIAFDGARARVVTSVALAPEATYAGWELWCLGRPASGERFTRGEVRSELAVRRGERLGLFERARFVGGDRSLEAPHGLRGKPVWGTFVVASPRASEAWVEAVREAVADEPDCAVTLVSGIVILRCLGNGTREVRLLFERALRVLRPLYAGREAVHPRIWST